MAGKCKYLCLVIATLLAVLGTSHQQSRHSDDSRDYDEDYGEDGAQSALVGPGGIEAVNGNQAAVLGPHGILASQGGQSAGIFGGNFPWGLPSSTGSHTNGHSGGAMSSQTGSGGSSTGHNGMGSVSMSSIGGQNVVMSNGGTVISGNGVSQMCNGATCQTCFNGRCFNRTYPAIRQQGMCAPVACEYGCLEFVMVGDDNCPTCRCKDFSTRELCHSSQDCDRNGRCEKQLCRYPAIIGSYSTLCDFSYQCTADKECSGGRCQSTSSSRIHATVPCVYVYQCPSSFPVCEGMTCWQDGGHGGTSTSAAQHVSGTPCTFDYQCPSQYSCQGMSCIRTGEIHGTSACALNSQCRRGERCVNMTCKPARGRPTRMIGLL